jgi:hypothetical protein
VFVVKLSTQGSPVWAQGIGGLGADSVGGLAIEEVGGDCFVVGTLGECLPLVPPLSRSLH